MRIIMLCQEVFYKNYIFFLQVKPSVFYARWLTLNWLSYDFNKYM